jgi:hypothetical protein
VEQARAEDCPQENRPESAKQAVGMRISSGESMMRVALYARVSTLNGQNPEMQLAELRELLRDANGKCSTSM